MPKLLAVAVFMLVTMVQVSAQTAIDDLPPGRRVAGWATEYIAQGAPSLGELEQAMGERVTSVAGPFRLTSASGKTSVGVVARAFFASQSQERYAFVLEFDGLRPYDQCAYKLSVGGADIISGSFFRPANENGSTDRLVGSATLVPGYYRTLVAVQCQASLKWRGTATAVVKVRSESSLAPALPAADELFHIVR